MEIEKIWQICKNHSCETCPFCDEEEECLINTIPLEWDLVEINRRLRNYGKEKTDRS